MPFVLVLAIVLSSGSDEPQVNVNRQTTPVKTNTETKRSTTPSLPTNTGTPQTQDEFFAKGEERVGLWWDAKIKWYVVIYKKNNAYYQLFYDGKDRTSPERAVVDTQSGKTVYRLTQGIDKAYYVVQDDGSLECWDIQGFISRATPVQ